MVLIVVTIGLGVELRVCTRAREPKVTHQPAMVDMDSTRYYHIDILRN